MKSSMDQEQHLPRPQAISLWSDWMEIEKFPLSVPEL